MFHSLGRVCPGTRMSVSHASNYYIVYPYRILLGTFDKNRTCNNRLSADCYNHLTTKVLFNLAPQ